MDSADDSDEDGTGVASGKEDAGSVGAAGAAGGGDNLTPCACACRMQGGMHFTETRLANLGAVLTEPKKRPIHKGYDSGDPVKRARADLWIG